MRMRHGVRRTKWAVPASVTRGCSQPKLPATTTSRRCSELQRAAGRGDKTVLSFVLAFVVRRPPDRLARQAPPTRRPGDECAGLCSPDSAHTDSKDGLTSSVVPVVNRALFASGAHRDRTGDLRLAKPGLARNGTFRRVHPSPLGRASHSGPCEEESDPAHEDLGSVKRNHHKRRSLEGDQRVDPERDPPEDE